MRNRERGNSILAVMVITLLINAVVLVVLMASSTLKEQSASSIERKTTRNEARSGVNLVAAYLNQRLTSMNPPLPPSTEWLTDSDNVKYMVIFGRGGNGTPSCTLDSSKTLATGSGPSTATVRNTWLSNARSYVASHPANTTFVARIEIVGDTATPDWYYRAWSVAATDNKAARSAKTTTALVSQAALVPYNRQPFQVGGLTGLQGVVLKGNGLLGTLNQADGNSQPVLSTNKNITKQ